MNKYLRAFIIGSSFPAFVLFFIRVYYLEHRNYSYFHYTLIAPVYLGLMNTLSLLLQEQYHLTDDQRYNYITLISVSIVFLFAYLINAYKFTVTERLFYLLRLLLLHGTVYQIIMRYLNTDEEIIPSPPAESLRLFDRTLS